jgi:saposin
MNICSTDEKPMIVGNNRCTWGPSYWCSSLSNSRQCASIDHCSNQIWSQQAIEKKANDNICQYCEYIIEKLRSFITENQTEVNSKI